jgi:capsular polysaccharide biosynthesis protein
MEARNSDEIEIDLKELFYILLNKLWIIVIVGILAAISAGLISKVFLKPIYTSTTSIYVINRQTEDKTTLSDLQTGTQLTQDYKILVKSRPVTEQVISDLNLTLTHEELIDMITVNTPENTRILEIEVRNPDAYVAKQLADAIAEVSAERMVSVMEMEKANIVEPGNLPLEPSSPNIKKNVIIGGIIGVFLSALCIILIYILNDSLKSAEDVERYLGLNTLGAIPMEEGVTKKKLKKKQVRNQLARAE